MKRLIGVIGYKSMEKNREAIEKVVAQYGDTIYRLALHYVRDRFDAEDVVQEVLFAFFQRETPNHGGRHGFCASR